MKILHVIEALDYSGSARQLQVVTPLVAANRCHVEICCLGSAGPWSVTLRQAGIAVHELRWSRWLDAAALLRLRAIVERLQPDVIHAWRRPALRALAVVARKHLRRALVSAPLPARGALPWWDRWLLRQVRCLAVAGESDQALCADAGLDRARVAIVPAAVAEYQSDASATAGRRIVCVGALRAEHGFREAIWALDILRHLFPDVELLLAGTGPYEAALRAFARGIHRTKEVHFLGAVENIGALLRSAEVCWIPSRANCGRQVALEALAQGCAVIASDVPCLRELVRDGETGLLSPRSDVVALARRTRLLLRDPALRQRLGTAAAAWAQQRCEAGAVARRWQELYARLAG